MRISLIKNNPNIDNSKKGIVAIPKSKIFQKEILIPILKTHGLSSDEIHFAISEILKMNLSEKDFANFILQSYLLTNTGRFSLSFNNKLDENIKSKMTIEKWVKMAGTKEGWPELYDNPYLTGEEIRIIEEMSNREYFAILNTIETFNSCKNAGDIEIFPCKTTQDDSVYLNDNIVYTSIYEQCYENVCISESVQRGKIISLKSGSDIPQVAYVGDGKGAKFCFKVMDLIEQLARGNYINAKNDEMFSDTVLNQLLAKYDKEIKMYKRFLEKKINP